MIWNGPRPRKQFLQVRTCVEDEQADNSDFNYHTKVCATISHSVF